MCIVYLFTMLVSNVTFNVVMYSEFECLFFSSTMAIIHFFFWFFCSMIRMPFFSRMWHIIMLWKGAVLDYILFQIKQKMFYVIKRATYSWFLSKLKHNCTCIILCLHYRITGMMRRRKKKKNLNKIVIYFIFVNFKIIIYFNYFFLLQYSVRSTHNIKSFIY